MEHLTNIIAVVLDVIPPWVGFSLIGLMVVAHYAQRSRDEQDDWTPTHRTVEVRP